MAYSQANEVCSFTFETDDFTIEERSSLYEILLKRQRDERKVCAGENVVGEDTFKVSRTPPGSSVLKFCIM